MVHLWISDGADRLVSHVASTLCSEGINFLKFQNTYQAGLLSKTEGLDKCAFSAVQVP